MGYIFVKIEITLYQHVETSVNPESGKEVTKQLFDAILEHE